MWYNVGTISINDASTTVTGSGTVWVGQVWPGDIIYVQDKLYEIDSITSNTELELTLAYSGSNISGETYEAIRNSVTNSELAARISNVILHWRNREAEIETWQGGVVGGGPANDGKYPLTDPDGSVVNVYCPAAIAAFAARSEVTSFLDAI